MANLGAESLLSASFACGSPQMNTSTLRIAHGVHALMTCARVNPCLTAIALASSWLTPSPSRVALVHTVAGRQIFRNAASAAIEHTDATTSTSHGPWKFDMRNWGAA